MSLPKVVTFDCAETLVRLGWHPFTAMTDCAERLGHELLEEHAHAYGDLFLEWRPEYEAANLSRDRRVLTEFWNELSREWLRRTGLPENRWQAISETADELTYGPESAWFGLFDDVVPCLDALDRMGVRLAVVSNWDLSLTPILESLDLAHRFELIVASLAEGVEKPDPALFHIALARLDVAPEEVVHVGDNPIDDMQGAAAAGVRAILIDRAASNPELPTIASLTLLPEVLTWNV